MPNLHLQIHPVFIPMTPRVIINPKSMQVNVGSIIKSNIAKESMIFTSPGPA
jgi:hypothetical protein